MKIERIKMTEYGDCPNCGGTGRVEVCNTSSSQWNNLCSSITCPRCNGTGKMFAGIYITKIKIK